MEQLTIRRMQTDDYLSVQALSMELGHNCTAEKVKERISAILTNNRDFLFAAQWGDEVIGYLHGCPYELLYADPLVNIIAFVVKEVYRGKGIGGRMLARFEEFAKENGFAGVRLNSRMERLDAHRFYENHGYKNNKNQKSFVKML